MTTMITRVLPRQPSRTTAENTAGTIILSGPGPSVPDEDGGDAPEVALFQVWLLRLAMVEASPGRRKPESVSQPLALTFVISPIVGQRPVANETPQQRLKPGDENTYPEDRCSRKMKCYPVCD